MHRTHLHHLGRRGRGNRRRRLAAVTIAAGMLATACSSDHVDGPGWAGGTGEMAMGDGLVTFDACDELTDWIASEGAPAVASLVGSDAWAMGDDVVFEEVGGSISSARDGGAADGPVPSFAPASPSSAAGEADQGPTPTYSATNNQEVAADEPDTVKTDGRRIVAIHGEQLEVLDATATGPVARGTVQVPVGSTLLLDGDRVLVLSAASGDGPVPMGRSSSEILPYGSGETTVLLVDLADPDQPRVLDRRTIEGAHVASRLIDGVAHVVVTAQPKPVDLVVPTGPGARDAAERANREVLAETDPQDWLPGIRGGDGSDLLGCEDVAHPAEFSGPGTTTVITIDPTDGLEDLSATAVLADTQTVYASGARLYLATQRWVDVSSSEVRPEFGGALTTELHALQVGAGGTSFLGSGSVPGHLLSQFSLSEHDGVLRVAVTEGSSCCGGGSSESSVRTLAVRDGSLVELGSVSGIGRGEEIYAVRFLGNVGYVVTFRQTDPLYTIDLSDPARPRVVGELHIPGYSSYLHPIGDGRLLGIGQDGTESGQLTGAQVSLFDVSDLSDPQRLAMHRLGDASTAAEHDHHALLWWPAEDLVVLPTESWGPGSFSGALLLRVTDGAITEVGRIRNDGTGVVPLVPETTTTTAPPTTGPPDTTTPDTTVPPDTTTPDTTVPDTTVPDTTVPDTIVPVMPPPPPPDEDLAVAMQDEIAGGRAAVEEVDPIAGAAVPPIDDSSAWVPVITRSLVVGDLLYTFSDAGVAATHLPTLTKAAWLPW